MYIFLSLTEMAHYTAITI